MVEQVPLKHLVGGSSPSAPTMKPILDKRPWGQFIQFTDNEICTVKIITVKPNSRLSLQYHNHRDEFWRVIEGEGQIVLGEDTIDVKKDDEFFIERKVLHRMMTKDKSMSIMEISYGEFDENDIVRVEDEYGRA